MRIGELDIEAGRGWAWDWRSMGEWTFQLGVQVDYEGRNVQVNLGLILVGFWVEFDW